MLEGISVVHDQCIYYSNLRLQEIIWLDSIILHGYYLRLSEKNGLLYYGLVVALTSAFIIVYTFNRNCCIVNRG